MIKKGLKTESKTFLILGRNSVFLRIVFQDFRYKIWKYTDKMTFALGGTRSSAGICRYL